MQSYAEITDQRVIVINTVYEAISKGRSPPTVSKKPSDPHRNLTSRVNQNRPKKGGPHLRQTDAGHVIAEGRTNYNAKLS